MKRKAIYLACLAALITLSISSIGTSHTSAAVANHAGRALKGTISIFDWGTFGSGTAGSVKGKAAVQAYERMHPGVTIKVVGLPPGNPTVYQESTLAAGTAQDISVPSYTQQVFNDLPKNYWLDLTPYLMQPDPYVKGNKRWIDIFDPAINGQNAFAGKYYVVSYSAQDATFFYNKDIFAKAGITGTPTTWAQLLDDSAKIKKAGYIPDLYFLGDTYPIGENGSIVSEIENQVMSKTFAKMDLNHDGVVDIKELVAGIKNGTYSPKNADYQEAWKLYKQWSQYWEPNAAGQKGPYTTSADAALPAFYQGKVGMIYNGQWLNGQPAMAKVKFKWGFFKFPQITPASSSFATPGAKGVGIWGAWNAIALGIPVATQKRGNLALALDFMRFATAPQNNIPIALDIGNFPVVKGYKPEGAFNTLFYDLLKHPTMQFAAEATLGPEWLNNRIAVQQQYILGMESLDQAMTDMQRYTNQAADRMVKLYHLSS
jgi:ABC-type glycerol-3-phosphate transport system substrate-binding protein